MSLRGRRTLWPAALEDAFVKAATLMLGRTIGLLPRIEPYTGFGTPRRVRIMARVLSSPRGPGARPQPVKRGFRAFLALPAPEQRVLISVADQAIEATSDRGGYIDIEVDLPPEAPLAPGWNHVTLTTVSPHPSMIRAGLLVIGNEVRLGVISDIDDTAMVTAVPKALVAAWNMLWVRTATRQAVRGMPELYAAIASQHPEAPFVYLSAGAWNTARTIRRFLVRHGFPAGPLLLTDFGPTNTRFFRSGREHKTSSLIRLFETFPHIRWVLLGDDGQADPEIYSTAAREHSDHVAAIGIRTLTRRQRFIATVGAAKDRSATSTQPALDSRVKTNGLDVPIVFGPDGEALAAELKGLIA